ncbi:regulator of protease activity HflC (stomatin/prohibitin superfamily) [Alteromonadaceae bacterium 2753L.S.0a.02]|nr:regulator of protease activity HflC (stomatin/prohibitin superfamily) [Alteromonadaceae bacterium 2753L.S.0a.02]
MFWKLVDIADSQRALVYERDRLVRVLEPGRYRIWSLGKNLRIDVYDITQVIFEHQNLKFLVRQYGELLKDYLQWVELSDTQVGLIYRDNKVSDILPPGALLANWQGIEDVRVDIVDIAKSYQIADELVSLLGRGLRMGSSRNVVNAIAYSEVPDEHVGLLTVNGKLEAILPTGSYGFWKYNRAIALKLLDLRLQAMEVSGQEILTKDRVSLRINLAASYRVVDPKIVALKLKDYANFLYVELQLLLREAVGTKNLDELLADKDALNTVIAAGVAEKAAQFGLKIHSVGVKDIILPGDMKLILNQVVEAQKEAEANLIKRREETQAMRSLHNTAKVMENNPVLLRLKELEALERITNKIDRISVYGGLDSVLNDLVKLAPAGSRQ